MKSGLARGKDEDIVMKEASSSGSATSVNHKLLFGEDQIKHLLSLGLFGNRALFKMMVHAYFHQLMNGCLLNNCTNTHCKRNTTITDTEAAKLSIDYAKKAFDKTNPQFFFCNTINPVLPHFSPTLDLCVQEESIRMIIDDAVKTGDYSILLETIKRVFCNDGSLSYSFQISDSFTKQTNYSIDNESVQRVYKIIMNSRNEEVINCLASSIEELGKRFCNHVDRVSNLNFIITILQCPLMMEPSSHKSLSLIMQGILKLSSNLLMKLKDLLTLTPREILSGFINILQQFITVQLYSRGYIDEAIAHATRVLGIINSSNEQKPFDQKVDYREFYNDAVNNIVDIKEDYFRWVNSLQTLEKGFDCFNFCEFPFVIDPNFKSKILQLDAEIQQNKELRNAFISSLFRQPTSLFCILKVNRHNLLQTALNEILNKADDLKKQLRVKFIGEEGIDEGGVRKEFFQLVLKQIFDVNYGMFEYDEKQRTFWFNPNSFESGDDFKLIGIVIGLAIYNSIILDIHFPLVVYKKMLGLKPTLEDLKETSPELGRGLQQLLDFDGDVEDVFCRTFQVESDVFGQIVTNDLKPNGGDIPVTSQNREEYVKLFVEWKLEKSIEKQFNSFIEGFKMVCSDQTILNLFRAEELELLICGSPVLDFEALERTTKYADGYDKDHPLIKDFWDIVHHFTEEEKKKFLMFCTGSDRVPIKGLGELGFVIVKNGDDDRRLPTAHTCFNHLLLPKYSSKENMKERLLSAINNCMGFGLQ